jgi:hypothetical protein
VKIGPETLPNDLLSQFLQAVFHNKSTTTTTATTTMKFSIALFVILSSAPTVVQADPIETCSDQKNCLDFTTTQVDIVDACISSVDEPVCEFNICMTLELGGDCIKSDIETVSHTCVKADNECLNGGSFGSALAKNTLENGYHACQVVSPGGIAEFLVKDGNGSCGVIATPVDFRDGTLGTCQKLEDNTEFFESCTGNVGKECVWTIQAPQCGEPTAADSSSDSRIGTSDEATAAEEEEYLCA